MVVYSPLATMQGVCEGMKFGDWLKMERTRRGWTLEMMGEKAGTTHASISRLESGRAGASEKMAIRLADALAGDEASVEDRDRLRTAARAARAGLEESRPTPEAERFLKLWEAADPIRRRIAEDVLTLLPTLPEPEQ